MKALMFTYKILRKEKSGILFVRVTKDRRKAEFNLGVVMSLKEYDNAMLLSSTASKQRHARYIKNIQDRLDAMQLDFVQYGFDRYMDVTSLRDKIKAEILFLPDETEKQEKEREAEKLFMPFFRRCIDSKSNEGYKVSREYTYKKIEEYCKNADSLTFEVIDLK